MKLILMYILGLEKLDIKYNKVHPEGKHESF